MENNLFDNIKNSDEVYYENKLRPLTIDEYIGQKSVKENVKVFVKAALMRNEAMDHVLLSGPPGLGKTTLSLII